MNLEVSSKTDFKNSPYFQLIIILIAGLILRIYLGSLISFEGDFNTWLRWGEGLSKVGFSKFYDNYWCDYMPGYLYVLRLLTEIQNELSWHPYILFKLPANLADFGISILIFIVIKPLSNKKVAMVSSLVYFFNPAVISNSTLWGQVDSFHAFPIMLALVLGLRKKFILSGLFAAVAFMIKPQTIVLFPIIGFIALQPFFSPLNRWNIRNFIPGIKIIIAAIITGIIISLPFIWYQIDSVFSVFSAPIELTKLRFEKAYEQYTYTSLNSFNFWGAFLMWVNDQNTFLGITYQNWGTIIFGSFYALIFGFFLRYKILFNTTKKEYTYLIFQAVTLILFCLFLFVTRAHERHLLPAIVFFTLIIYRSWIFPYLYAIVSGVYVCNMIYAYFQLITKYQAVPGNVQVYLLPLMFLLYFAAFVIVLLNFFKHTWREQDTIKTNLTP